MKNSIKIICCMLLLFLGLNLQAQTTTTENSTTKNHSIMVSARAGYDFPWYYNNTPYIKTKGGAMAGISVDYYWKYIGVGLDVDYLRNKPKSTYPTKSLQDGSGTPITSFRNTSKAVNRVFFGIGPDFRYYTKNKKFVAELNTRVGIAMIKGGRTELRETTTPVNYLLNFHAGYDEKTALTAKAQLRLSYFFHKNIGVHIGTYYMYHFNVTEKTDAATGMVAKYQPFTTTGTTSTYSGPSSVRTKSCDCDIASVGVFAGITYNLDFGKSKEKTSNHTLVVTAKDKYTNEVLPNTIVYLKDDANNIIQTATTDNNGVVKFEKVKPNNYRIEGTLNTVALDANSVSKSELSKKKTINKEILYSDKNFIIKGRVFVCNSTTPISGITVVLENNDLAFKKTTQTNANGEYLLQLPATGEYNLYGKKDSYFSQIERINTANYKRDKNLFVKLEMCSELIDCDKAIKLNNILFDVAKYDIKDAAKPELNKLIQFMKDNPTVKVELSSHTDSRATTEYNQTLSQQRADASVDYIVSKGIARDRLTGKGYGESKLLNGCADGVTCTEAQHAINRRTEMKVLCK
jgi:outer membrane protein OmpA-like peptidoglycan-associated protein